MLNQLFGVTCLLLVFQQQVVESLDPGRDGSGIERKAGKIHLDKRTEFKKPDLVQYMKDNCGIDIEAQEEGHNPPVTIEDISEHYEDSGIVEWRDEFKQAVEDYLSGNADALSLPRIRSFYNSVVCSMGIMDELVVEGMTAGEAQLCEGEDVDTTDSSSIFACIRKNIVHLKKVGPTLAEDKRVSDAVATLTRMVITLNRIRRALVYLGQIHRERRNLARDSDGEYNREKREDFSGLLEYINNHCHPDRVILDELNDNKPITLEALKASATKADIGEWLDDLDAGASDPPSVNTDWVAEKYNQIACSLAPVYLMTNEMFEGGQSEVCEGREVDGSAIDAVAECFLVNLADVTQFGDEIDAMDEDSSVEYGKVLVMRLNLAIGRIQHGLWLIAEDMGGEV